MHYGDFVEMYQKLSKTTKKLEKTRILADFLPTLKGHEEYIYLLVGRVFPAYDSREFGISIQLTTKAIAKASGCSTEEVVEAFRKQGDLGDVAASLIISRKQHSLFSKKLDVEHVLTSLRKICEIEGKGTVDMKMNMIIDLLMNASSEEARYLVRTLLSDLRVGTADALLIDAISLAFFEGDEEMNEKIKNACDLLTDFAQVLKWLSKERNHSIRFLSYLDVR